MAAKNPKKLKVYRTAIGFHDAYVAALSKKAALAAWGTTKDLFARNAAEIVEDPALMAEALAHPGDVIKRARGTAEEQIAALPPTERKQRPAKGGEGSSQKAAKPSRAKVDRAEQALTDAEQRQEAELAALRREEKVLAQRRRTLADAQTKESRQLKAKIEAARDDYEAALSVWRNG